MKFTQIVEFYKVNDDCTVTVKHGDDYFRCRCKMDVLLKCSQFKEGEAFEGVFGLFRQRGVGLQIQLIDC